MNDTKIQWTDSTWNPMRGCSRISPGCEHCYAEGIAARFSRSGQPFEGYAKRGQATGWHPKWTGKVSLVGDQLETPLTWRKPRRIFVNSMSDTFHEKLSIEEIAAVFGVMALACHHTYQVLTKRAERMADVLSKLTLDLVLEAAIMAGVAVSRQQTIAVQKALLPGSPFAASSSASIWPLPNAWVGVSVEDQRRADERIPHLLRVPAAVRFLSVEPQLEAIDLTPWLGTACRVRPHGVEHSPASCSNEAHYSRGVDWLIAGGESGRGARPFDLAWARSLRDQCKAAGTRYFLKQLGANAHQSSEDADKFGSIAEMRDSHGGAEAEWPADLQGCRAFPEVRP